MTKAMDYMDVQHKMEIPTWQDGKVRTRADALVEDPKTAESLKPYYRQFCKDLASR